MRSFKRGPVVMFSVLLVLMLAFTTACGGDGDDDEDEATSTPAAAAATATTAPAEEEEEEEEEEESNGGGADVEAGRQLAAQQCAACHTTDGTQAVGPSWQGLYNSEVELEDGSTVTADEAYIEESIRDPNAKVHAGFPANVMPVYEGTLTDDQIAQLVAYIVSLE